MSGPLFDQYKAALRRGHLAALSGGLDEALEAYREAARLVPERSLPRASQGTVLHRMDRWPEALAAFDQALRLSPDDELTLRARGGAREERGLRAEAAGDFERLTFVLDVAGRGPEAVLAARRAAELDASPARSALVTRLSEAVARGDAPGESGPEPVHARIVPETAAEAARAANTEDPAESWPPLDLPTTPPPIVGPPPDPETLMANATVLLDAGDTSAARDLMLMAVLVHRQSGRFDAALDICLHLLSMAPGDPQVHLAIANLQLDHGWTALATEKIELLLRLTSLTGDTQAEADVHGVAAERLRDAPAASTMAG